MSSSTTFLNANFFKYTAAKEALGVFESLVIDQLNRVVIPRTAELSAKLRIQLNRSNWQPDVDGSGIGIRTQTKGHGIIGFSVEWYKHPDGPESVYLLAWWAQPDKITGARVFRTLQKHSANPRLVIVGATLRLERELDASDVENLQAKIDETVTEWVTIWASAGGVPGVAVDL